MDMIEDAALFTSTTDDWPIPADLFATLDGEFGFTLDACASRANAKCARYFDRGSNGLIQTWRGTVWCNPPYGREIGAWVAKAHDASEQGATVVMLIPARTDTAYWHEHAMQAAEIRLIRGRLHFANEDHAARVANGEANGHNAPFPSALLIFRPYENEPVLTACDTAGRPLSSRSTQRALEFGGAA